MPAVTKKTTKKKANSKAKAKPASKANAAKKDELQRDPVRVELFAIAYIAVAIILLLVFLFFGIDEVMSGAGVVGVALSKFFATLLGKARFCLPFLLLLLGWFYWKKRDETFPFRRSVVFSCILFFTIVTAFAIFKPLAGYSNFVSTAIYHGGYIGDTIAWLLLKAFGTTISVVILVVLLLASLVAVTGISFFGFMRKAGNNIGEAGRSISAKMQERREREPAPAQEGEPVVVVVPPESVKPKIVLPDNVDAETGEILPDGDEEPEVWDEYDVEYPSLGQHIATRTVAPVIEGDDPDLGLKAGPDWDEELPSYKEKPVKRTKQDPVIMEEIDVEPKITIEDPEPTVPVVVADHEADVVVADAEEQPPRPYVLPKTSLLQKASKANHKEANKIIKESIDVLESTLASFGVAAKVTEVSYGPSITRFEVKPGPGVKVAKIVNLADDIALQLKASGIRMEAPVPGKSVIGIEVPRQDTTTVSFRDVLENSDFFKLPSKITCAFGKDIAGQPVIGDLASMPHLLIAGATGSGKSVCLNTIICSLLFKAKPNEVKFIMVDPKRVEFAAYEGLPHLLTPVVTDPKKAAGALKWALRAMEERYALFNQNRVKNLEGYNQLVTLEEDKLPQIIVFIDELADLMMVAAKDVEESICRLAQMARAAGIHLVIATQRPSVDVITGLIKANIPSRIAFAVSSQTDSRTILDMGGAEKLLGRGDMLYHPVGMAKPLRVQGAYVSEEESAALLAQVKAQGTPDYVEGVAQPIGDDKRDREQFEDELFHEAAKAVITAGQASASSLQRRFRIGYNRAARLMEVLQEKGVVGPADGARPRQVLMTLDSFLSAYPLPAGEETLFDEDH